MKREIFLLRHGITEAQEQHYYGGRLDLPLSEEGRAALRGRQYPPAEEYVSTPFCRATETLRLLYGDVAYRLCPELAEYDFGEYEGHTYDELSTRPDYQAWILDETGTAAPPGGESRNEHTRRVLLGMDALLREDARTLAVVCHGGTIVRLMERWFPGERDFYGWQPLCGEGWRIVLEDDRPLFYEPINGRKTAC